MERLWRSQKRFPGNSTDGDGEKTLYARFANAAGDQSEVAFDSIVLDTSDPKLTVTAPEVSALETVTIAGTVEDLTGVALTIDGTAVDVAGAKFSFEATLEAEGENTFEVSAVDAVGHETTALVAVVLDSLAPALSITEPAEEAIVGTTPVIVTGTVVDSTTVTVVVNGVEATVAGELWTAEVLVSDGTEVLSATATDAAELSTTTERTVLVDLVDPVLTDIQPISGSATRNATVTVQGRVEDDTATTVTVNGVEAAQTADHEFFAFGVPLTWDENTLSLVATDQAGHTASATIIITLDETPPELPTDVTVTPVDEGARVCGIAEVGATVIVAIGDNSEQATATADGFCATVEIPEGETQVFVTVTDAAGNASDTAIVALDSAVPGTPIVSSSLVSPTSRRAVVLYGVAEPGSEVHVSGGLEEKSSRARADTGFYLVGVELYTNRINTLSLIAVDAAGNPSEPASVSVEQDETAGPPKRQLTIFAGQSQRGVDGEALAKPLDVMVIDELRQPIAGVSVDFQVVGGGGSLEPDEVVSGPDGHAQVTWTMGPAGPAGDQIVLADVAQNEGSPVCFSATSLAPNLGGATTIVGVVLGNNLEPIDGATATIVDPPAPEPPSPNAGHSAITGPDGEFEIPDLTPALQQHVFVDPGNQAYPPITQIIDAWAGQDNTLGKPIFLPNLDLDTAATVSATEGGVSGSEDLFVTIGAGQATFLDGTNEGEVIVSPVPSLRIPMPLPGSVATDSVISVMPLNVHFNPPAAVTFPNTTGAAPGARFNLLSFDHALGAYVTVGTATASEDGTQVLTDPGSGIRWGAWHPIDNPSRDIRDTIIKIKNDPTLSDEEKKKRLDRIKRAAEPIANPDLEAEPIDLHSGAYTYSHADLEVPGRHMAFRFERFYSSRFDLGEAPLGYGWTHSYNRHLEFSKTEQCDLLGPGGVSGQLNRAAEETLFGPIPVSCNCNLSLSFFFSCVCSPDFPPEVNVEAVCPKEPSTDDVFYVDHMGRVQSYRALGGGAFESSPDVYATLTHDESGFTLSRRDGFVERFDEEGLLRSIADRYGDTLQFQYDGAENMVAVSDPLGHVFRFGYDDKGRIVSLTDHTFRRVWRYAYDANDDLVSVTEPATPGFPDGTTVQYSYLSSQSEELKHNMLTITDQRGITWLENTYGTVPGSYAFDKVIAQRHGNDLATLQYEELNSGAAEDLTTPRNLTRQIDADGDIRESLHNAAGHNIELRVFTNRRVRSSDPPVFVTRRQYNAAGEMTRIDLPRGNVVVYTYDDSNADPFMRGNLLRMETHPGSLGDAEPLVQTWTYEPRFGFVKTHIGPRGHASDEGPPERFTTTYSYDYEVPGGNQFGDVVTVSHLVDGVLRVTESTYNQFGQLTREVDAEGNATTYDYFSEADPTGTGSFVRAGRNGDAGGYKKQRIDDADNLQLETSYTYDPFGRVVKIKAPTGAESEIDYDALDRIVKTIDPLNDETCITYDAVGNPTRSERDVRGDENASDLGAVITTEYQYDDLSRVTVQLDQIDAVTFVHTTFEYDAAGHRVRQTSPEGISTLTIYDERDLQVSTTVAGTVGGARTLTYDYDVQGNMTRVTDPAGHVTTTEFDAFDRRVAVVDTIGTRVEWTLDAAGNQTSVRTTGLDEAGASTLLGQARFIYNEDNQIVQSDRDVLSPLGALLGTATSSTRYDRLGRAVEATDEAENVTTFTYDGLSRLTVVADELGNRTEYQYGPHPSPTSTTQRWPDVETDSDVTFPWQTEFDLLERPLASITPKDERTTFEYNSRGLPVRVTDTLKNVMRTAYDGRGLKIRSQVELRAGGIGEGELEVNDANPDGFMETRWEYDQDGRLTAVQGDRVGATRYAYNELGDLASITDALGHAVSTNEYDSEGLLLHATDASGTVFDFEYDDGHRMTRSEVAAAAGLLPSEPQTFDYDGLGRMTRATDENDPGDATDDVTVSRTYDSTGNIVSQIESDRTVEFTYDLAGRPVTMVYPDGTVLGFSDYDELNRPLGASVNGVPVRTDRYVGADLVSRTYGNGVTTDFTYNDNNDLARIEHSVGSALLDGYAYDYRKLGEPSSVAYLHDDNHSDAYTLDSAGRLVGVTTDTSTVAFTLDGDSNRVIEAKDDGVARAYESDAMGQYILVDGVARSYDDSGRLTFDGTRTFTYDGRGRLRAVDGVSYTYNALGWLVRRTSDSEDTHISYVGTLPIEERDASDTVTTRYYTIGRDLFAVDLAGERCFVHGDRLDSVTALTDDDGTVVERYEYDPFGARDATDALGASVSPALAFGFTIQRHDDAANLILFPTPGRALDPKTGHFIKRDPLGAALQGPNEYAYTGHSPTALIDPTGLAPGPMQYRVPSQAEMEQGRNFERALANYDRAWKTGYVGLNMLFGGEAVAQAAAGSVANSPEEAQMFLNSTRTSAAVGRAGILMAMAGSGGIVGALTGAGLSAVTATHLANELEIDENGGLRPKPGSRLATLLNPSAPIKKKLLAASGLGLDLASLAAWLKGLPKQMEGVEVPRIFQGRDYGSAPGRPHIPRPIGPPPGPRTFPNQSPNTLPEEQKILDRLKKVKIDGQPMGPMSPDNPLFPTIANSGTLKFVVLEDGQLLVFPSTVNGVEVSHAAIAGGRNVLTAGEIEIASRGGTIYGTTISPHSGHYFSGLPAQSMQSLDAAIDAFGRYGIKFAVTVRP